VDEVLAQLLGHLADRDRYWVISLDGMTGLGKAALAREAAGRLAFGLFACVIGRIPEPVTRAPYLKAARRLPGLCMLCVQSAFLVSVAGVKLDMVADEAEDTMQTERYGHPPLL
jgi:hypothetical protein